jgi:HEAT repeat protein
MPLVRKPTKTTPAPSTDAADVLKALTSANSDERLTAARAAATVSGGIEALATALRIESDARVREAIFTSLARIGSSESVSAIVPLVRSDDASVRTGALDALRVMASAARVHLQTLLIDPDADVRLLSCEIARGLPSEEASQILSDLLTRESEINVCAAAVEVLAEVGTAHALPCLLRCEERFRDTPFLAFAVKIAKDRIAAQMADRSTPHHG